MFWRIELTYSIFRAPAEALAVAERVLSFDPMQGLSYLCKAHLHLGSMRCRGSVREGGGPR
jgi:hypothetical protein